MSDETQSKKWYKSKTILGVIITAVSIAAPKYKPIADALPAAVDQVGVLVGLILSTYGRMKADKPITK